MSQAADEISFSRITIVGLGLLGGSFAALARRSALSQEVIGTDIVPAHMEIAERLGFVDRVIPDPIKCVIGANLVVLCVPSDEVFKVMDRVGHHIRPDALILCTAGITDRLRQQLVTHTSVAKQLVSVFPLIHSLAVGPGAGSACVLQDQQCLVSRGQSVSLQLLRRVKDVCQKLGVKPIVMEAGDFEKAVAVHWYWPKAIALAAKRVCQQDGWPLGESTLAAWFANVPVANELDRNFQLHSEVLCDLLEALTAEIEQMQQLLGKYRKEPTNGSHQTPDDRD